MFNFFAPYKYSYLFKFFEPYNYANHNGKTPALTQWHEKHLVLLEAGDIKRVFLHDAVQPVQLLQMILKFNLILGQLPQRLFLPRCQPLFLVMSRKLQHLLRWKMLVWRQLVLSSRNIMFDNHYSHDAVTVNNRVIVSFNILPNAS